MSLGPSFTMFGGTRRHCPAVQALTAAARTARKIAGHLTIAAITDLAVIVGGTVAQYAVARPSAWPDGLAATAAEPAPVLAAPWRHNRPLNGATIIVVAGGGDGVPAGPIPNIERWRSRNL